MTPGQIRTVSVGSDEIRYRLLYASRNTLQIRVHPDLEVTAVAPLGNLPEEIDATVRSRAPWIRRQQREFGTYQPLPQPRRFIGGETHRYLGRQYRLRLSKGEDGVRLQHPFLLVCTPAPTDSARVKELLGAWYRERAGEVFPERLAHCVRVLRPILATIPPLHIRTMTRRWGSCSRGGTITLNVELVQVPTPCVDYVIVHELCHLREPNHGAAYYDLLSLFRPDWRERRARLNQALC
jgi:predicted metal-dependent hydrolase